MTCSTTSMKFPAHEAYLARTVVPRDTTANINGIFTETTKEPCHTKTGLTIFVAILKKCLAGTSPAKLSFSMALTIKLFSVVLTVYMLQFMSYQEKGWLGCFCMTPVHASSYIQPQPQSLEDHYLVMMPLIRLITFCGLNQPISHSIYITPSALVGIT